MFASVLIIIISGALFVYWFRYTCLLILNTKTTRDYAPDVAAANQLTFLDVRSKLALEPRGVAASNPGLDGLHESLDRDYRLVVYLMQHAVNCEAVKEPIEHWVLRFDYRLMSVWFWITRGMSMSLARAALLEMTSIVGHLANSMGERNSVSAGA